LKRRDRGNIFENVASGGDEKKGYRKRKTKSSKKEIAVEERVERRFGAPQGKDKTREYSNA